MYEPGQSIVLKDRQVLRGSCPPEPLRLEAAYLARRRCATVRRLAADDPSASSDHCTGVRRRSRPRIRRGDRKRTDAANRQRMAAVLARARIGERIACNHRQAEHVIEFAIGQQSGIRGHRRAAKLEHDVAVKSSLRAPPFDSPAGCAMTRASMRE